MLWAEPLIALNHSDATRQTFDQLRVFAGVSLRVSGHADVELGYLNQHLHRLSGDVNNDVVPVALNLHFLGWRGRAGRTPPVRRTPAFALIAAPTPARG